LSLAHDLSDINNVICPFEDRVEAGWMKFSPQMSAAEAERMVKLA
jgi:hypothetical protein